MLFELNRRVAASLNSLWFKSYGQLTRPIKLKFFS